MWILYASLTALFAGLAVIFAKAGTKRIDHEVAAAISSITVLIYCWINVFTKNSQTEIANISSRSFVYLALSGAALGGALICFIWALKRGPVAKATAFGILGGIIPIIISVFVYRSFDNLILRIIFLLCIIIGVLLMVTGKKRSKGSGWVLPSILTAALIAASIILDNIGVTTEGEIKNALISTAVMLIVLIAVFIRAIRSGISRIPLSEIFFSVLCGLAFCAFASCYSSALSLGSNAATVAIRDTSILISIGLAALFFKERISWKSACGLLLIVTGTLLSIFILHSYII